MGTEHDIANTLQAATEAYQADASTAAALDEALLAALSSIYVATENAQAGVIDPRHALTHINELARLALLAIEARLAD